MRKVRELGAGIKSIAYCMPLRGGSSSGTISANSLSRSAISNGWFSEGGFLQRDLGKVMWLVDASLARTIR